MQTPEEFIENFLVHQYDPIDRHQRYLRERELVGRRPTSTKPLAVQRSGILHPTAARPSKVTPKKMADHKKETQAKVTALQAKLEQLRQVLHDLMLQVRARGLDTVPDSTSGNSKPSVTTLAQKKAAAEASQKYRDAHKNDPKTPDQQLKEIQTKIDQLNKKIAEMRAKLKNQNTPLQTRTTKPGTVGDKIR